MIVCVFPKKPLVISWTKTYFRLNIDIRTKSTSQIRHDDITEDVVHVIKVHQRIGLTHNFVSNGLCVCMFCGCHEIHCLNIFKHGTHKMKVDLIQKLWSLFYSNAQTSKPFSVNHKLLWWKMCSTKCIILQGDATL